jgi:hypothetical protein
MYKALTLALLVSLCCSAQTVTINQTVTQGDGTQITVSGSLKLSAVPVDASSVPPTQLLSRFAFPYPNLQTGAPAPANLTGFGSRFDGAQHNPSAYDAWVASGTDPRVLNPKGVYLKHVNFVTADVNQCNVKIEGRPDYCDIALNHPQWILRNSANAIVTLYGPTDAVLDWGNDAYIDYLIATTIPAILDSYETAATTPAIYFEHDNGSFYARNYTPLAGASYAYAYNTDAGVQAAWLHLIGRLHAAFPTLKIVISSFPDLNRSISSQMTVFQSIFLAADGYYSEGLTDRHVWWGKTGSGVSDAQKRNALNVTMQLASWLADHGKIFMPMEGQGDGIAMSQADTDYAYAVFNLFRKGDKQFFCKFSMSGTNWVPAEFPEMNLPIGSAVDTAAVSIGANVWRRKFTKAESYVNWSSASVTVTPSPGSVWKNALGTAFSTITLQPFTGLTVYR